MKKPYIAVINANVNKDSSLTKKSFITPSIIEKKPSLFSDESVYSITETTTELFSDVAKVINDIVDKNVQSQAVDIVNYMSRYLRNVDTKSLRFPKLSAILNEDSSCLMEWHFAKFYIGFSLDPNVNDSYYFLVSVDESINAIETKTRRINGEIGKITNDIVQFVINNI